MDFSKHETLMHISSLYIDVNPAILTHQIEHCIFSPKWPLLPSILLEVFHLGFSHTLDHHTDAWRDQSQLFSWCFGLQRERSYRPNPCAQYLCHLDIPIK